MSGNRIQEYDLRWKIQRGTKVLIDHIVWQVLCSYTSCRDEGFGILHDISPTLNLGFHCSV